MRRIIRTIAILSLLGLGVWGYKRTFPVPRVKAPTTHYHGYDLNRRAIKNAKKFTVLITSEGFGSIERGSGVLIDSMTVLTCNHVATASNEQLWVITWPGNDIYHAKIGRQNPSYDLATLKLDRPVEDLPFATFQEAYYDGEPITIIGNILGSMKWFVSYGIISGSNERDLYTDGLILGGNSGGPWVNEAGEVVALSDWGLQINGVPVGINGGISGATIKKFRDEKGMLQILRMLLGG